ncbi:60S ribosome subunit biogenesis protein NIP7-like isoform X2 [Sigmodon hispidus]
MRPLTEEETRVMFEKIAKYIGENLQLLVDRPNGTYCFRLHNDRVYYVSEMILKLAANISGDKLDKCHWGRVLESLLRPTSSGCTLQLSIILHPIRSIKCG